METAIGFLGGVAAQVGATAAANWPFLAASIVVATALSTFVDQRAVAGFLQRHRRSGVLAATAAGVGTPLCSCGTTAVVLGMMATVMPWAPVVAFMVASPLTSPQELIYSAGLFGWPFALTFFAASIVLGIAGGIAAHVLEGAGLLEGQSRVVPATGCASEAAARVTLRRFARDLATNGRRLALLFLSFSALGYLLNGLIPEGAIGSLFGSGRAWGIPIAATLGVPFYFNTEASLPMLRPMMEAGMSPGAALAFLITGAGTSIGAIAGALTIARWRVVALVIGTLWSGAIVFGFAYEALRPVLS